MRLTFVLLLLFLFLAEIGFSAEKDYSTPGWREKVETLKKELRFLKPTSGWQEDAGGMVFFKADSAEKIRDISSYFAVKVLSQKTPVFKVFADNLHITMEYPAADGFDGYRIKDFEEIRKLQKAVSGLQGFINRLKGISPMPENPTYLYFRHKDGVEPYAVTESDGKTWNVADFTKFSGKD